MDFLADHIERIKEFGYTESEAGFLYIVAVHSGYFTLGQFRAFTGTAYGKRPTSFAEKVLKRGHATIRDYMRRGSIFHLFSRTIYGQIDKDNLRNRKRKEARRRFHGDRFESLYQGWSTGTITERDLRLEFSQLKPDRPVFFGTFLVQEHSSPVAEVNRGGEGCVKGTRNPPRHRSRHPLGDAKLLGA